MPIFSEWLEEWNRKLLFKKCSVQVIINNCPAHPRKLEFSNFSIKFLPVTRVYPTHNYFHTPFIITFITVVSTLEQILLRFYIRHMTQTLRFKLFSTMRFMLKDHLRILLELSMTPLYPNR